MHVRNENNDLNKSIHNLAQYKIVATWFIYKGELGELSLQEQNITRKILTR